MEKEILEILKAMQSDIKDLKVGQDRIEKKLDAVYEQTVDLTEFRTETSEKIDYIAKDTGFIKHKLNRTEEDVYNIQSHLHLIK